jgi:hypothetical protein
MTPSAGVPAEPKTRLVLTVAATLSALVLTVEIKPPEAMVSVREPPPVIGVVEEVTNPLKPSM